MSKCSHCETTGIVGVTCDRCKILALESSLIGLRIAYDSRGDELSKSQAEVMRLKRLVSMYESD